eukprot:6477466-Alexandrium_andersonii.AAC.1
MGRRVDTEPLELVGEVRRCETRWRWAPYSASAIAGSRSVVVDPLTLTPTSLSAVPSHVVRGRLRPCRRRGRLLLRPGRWRWCLPPALRPLWSARSAPSLWRRAFLRV